MIPPLLSPNRKSSVSKVRFFLAANPRQRSLCLGREQRHLLMQKLNQRRLDSRVCVLKNMVGAEDVDDSLQQEITGSKTILTFSIDRKDFVKSVEECSKYGEVIKVVIYTEQQGEDDTSEQLVKIFVEFQLSKRK